MFPETGTQTGEVDDLSSAVVSTVGVNIQERFEIYVASVFDEIIRSVFFSVYFIDVEKVLKKYISQRWVATTPLLFFSRIFKRCCFGVNQTVNDGASRPSFENDVSTLNKANELAPLLCPPQGRRWECNCSLSQSGLETNATLPQSLSSVFPVFSSSCFFSYSCAVAAPRFALSCAVGFIASF